MRLLLAFLLAAPVHAATPDLGAELKGIFDGRGGKQPGFAGLLSAPAEAVPPLPGSDWVPADPGGTTSDGNVTAPDKIGFWTRLQDKTFDGLCRQAQIPIEFGRRIGGVTEPRGEFHRYLRQMPTGELAIIDQGMLSLPAGWLPRKTFDHAHLHSNFDLFLGARIQGRSSVIRRLESKKACAELSKLVDFRTIKTVLPITAERIASMAEGEIWQLPVSFRIGVGGDMGDSLKFPVTIALGAYRESEVTVTLRRLDARTIRFRLRLEQATLLDAGGKVNANIPLLVFGLPGAESVLLRFVGETLARAVNDFVSVQLELGTHRQKGTQHAIEFVLDPADPEQMERLARAIQGDLSVLDLIRRSSRGVFRRGGSDPWDALEEAARDEEEALGTKPTFAGQDKYRRVQKPFKLRVPIAGRYERHTASESDHVVVRDRGQGRYSVYRAEKRTRRGFLDIPFLGELFARDSQKNADVMVHRDPDGKAQGPAIVYLQQEGFLRQDANDARKMAERASELMRLAGALGEGTNLRTELPVERLVPPGACGKPDCPPPQPGAFWREIEYRRGVAALTVVLNEPAVRDILKAGTKAVLKAYANTLDGPSRLMADWLLDNSRTSARAVSYDKKAAKAEAKRIAEAAGIPAWRVLRGLRKSASQVSALAAQLSAVRRKRGAEGKAQQLVKLLSGAGRGKLSYGDALKVLVQLADPLDISAEFFIDLVGKDGKDETRSRFVLHADARSDELLEGATAAKARFRRPTILTD